MQRGRGCRIATPGQRALAARAPRARRWSAARRRVGAKGAKDGRHTETPCAHAYPRACSHTCISRGHANWALDTHGPSPLPALMPAPQDELPLPCGAVPDTLAPGKTRPQRAASCCRARGRTAGPEELPPRPRNPPGVVQVLSWTRGRAVSGTRTWSLPSAHPRALRSLRVDHRTPRPATGSARLRAASRWARTSHTQPTAPSPPALAPALTLARVSPRVSPSESPSRVSHADLTRESHT